MKRQRRISAWSGVLGGLTLATLFLVAANVSAGVPLPDRVDLVGTVTLAEPPEDDYLYILGDGYKDVAGITVTDFTDVDNGSFSIKWGWDFNFGNLDITHFTVTDNLTGTLVLSELLDMGSLAGALQDLMRDAGYSDATISLRDGESLADGFRITLAEFVMNPSDPPVRHDFIPQYSDYTIRFYAKSGGAGGDVSGVPEPATLLILGFGAMGAGIAARRRLRGK